MLPDTALKIGAAIKHRRETMRISQERLALVANLALRTVRMVEQGSGNPSIHTLILLFDVLGLELSVNIKNVAIQLQDIEGQSPAIPVTKENGDERSSEI